VRTSTLIYSNSFDDHVTYQVKGTESPGLTIDSTGAAEANFKRLLSAPLRHPVNRSVRRCNANSCPRSAVRARNHLINVPILEANKRI
jgi:hypothetical protein